MYKLIKNSDRTWCSFGCSRRRKFFLAGSSQLELKTEQVDFHIAPGSSLRMAANEIANSGVVVDPFASYCSGQSDACRVGHQGRELRDQSGNYASGVIEKS